MNNSLVYRNVPFSPPDVTEAEAEEVKRAILSGWITTGPRTKKLERLIAGSVDVFDGCNDGSINPNCVCLNSQTACGEMALRILGVGPGDEVIVPAYTYTASASVISHVGAKVVLVDIQKQTNEKEDYCLQMDYDQLESVITRNTKAIIPVDLGGVPCDYKRISEIVDTKKYLFHPANDIQGLFGRIAICADGAHAYGANWNGQKVGSIADFTNFSFHAVKNFTTAEGGAMTWNIPFGNEVLKSQQVYYGSKIPVIENESWNHFIYRLAQLFSLHGQSKDALAKINPGAWEYDIIGPWYKCNMTDVVAAIGLIQFQRYPDMLKRRKQIIKQMTSAFANLPVSVLKHYTGEYSSSGHLFLSRLLGKEREEANFVISKMAERGIACNVHYKPLPMLTAYKAMGYDLNDFPNSYHMYKNEVSLPLNTKMTDDDVDYVINNYINIISSL